ncbi:MAG: thioredoxin domain-containing protein, partial [Alphaproteobacteria bacterium]|nr:thioredoxin domain-containing protein [Alphaproteobacteria bacterium]
MANALANATSPYLRQHQDNPVDWRPWTAQALADAKAGDKPILLSIGYAACHWCHVMAHESFEDAAIARLMNDNFVCVKVDREERPDLDHIYQSALAAMGEHGGWPLTMILTPDGDPFWGGTYIPPEPRWGRPGFPDLLRQLIKVYRDAPEKITAVTDDLATALRAKSTRAPSSEDPKNIDALAKWLAGIMDTTDGGFPGAPKFPMAMALDFLWRGYLRTGDAAMKTAVITALDRMCQGGIYDHLGGGFSRYATDDRWLVPHFEKMLYDNALLLGVLANAWADDGSPLYDVRVRETVAWVLREMTTEAGGFVSSFDADSEGVEGKFYVWTAEEINTVLGAQDAQIFGAAYDVSTGGNWEGQTILNRSAAPELGDGAHEKSLGSMGAKLLAARGARIVPGRDDKVLADWNGLMIAALARASITFREPSWAAAAAQAFDRVCGFQSADIRLCHSTLGEAKNSVSFLTDYGAMAGAALALFEATGQADYVAQAERWIGVLDDQFLDAENGGYFFTPLDADPLILRPHHATDDATPSGNALVADALARLFYLTGKDGYRQRAEAIHRAFPPAEDHDVVGLASLLMAAEVLQTGLEIVVLGEPDDPATQALIHAAHVSAPPHRILHWLAPGQILPRTHPGTLGPTHPAWG